MPPPTSHQLNPVNSLCAINWIHSIYYVHTAITPFYSFASTVANTFEPGLSSHLGFPGGKVVKNLPANAGETRDTASMLGSGRSPGGGKATHSSILAWKIPRTEEPGGLHWTQLSTAQQLLSYTLASLTLSLLCSPSSTLQSSSPRLLTLSLKDSSGIRPNNKTRQYCFPSISPSDPTPLPSIRQRSLLSLWSPVASIEFTSNILINWKSPWITK